MSETWILEGYFDEKSNQLQRLPIESLPAILGRDSSAPLAIARSAISRHHAEFFEHNGQLYLRDLNSTNGTFINHKPLKGDAPVEHGDVLHFASCEVRLLKEQGDITVDTASMTQFSFAPLSNRLPTGLSDLQQLLDEGIVDVVFQPITFSDGRLYAYEVLGRGGRHNLPVSPYELFRIAESVPNKASELSRLMRECGVKQALAQNQCPRLFLNTHPEELKDIETLLASLKQLKQQSGFIKLVLEIHEDAVTDIEQLQYFTAELQALDIELAYDDFGAGQARLMEMAEVSVRCVKFDIALIRGLHKAPEAKQKMVTSLVEMTQNLGIQALAEGVEFAEELAICQKIGFDLIQGFYFGKPKPSLDYQESV